MTSAQVVIPAPEHPAKILVLASGSGTLLQALLDELTVRPGQFEIVAVGADRTTCVALDRAVGAGIPTFSVIVKEFEQRPDWDKALADQCAQFEPDLIVSAGFMKLVGERFLARFPLRMINTHPSLLPSFPGMYAPRDALAHGAKVSGCTVFVVDGGWMPDPCWLNERCRFSTTTPLKHCTNGSKWPNGHCWWRSSPR